MSADPAGAWTRVKDVFAEALERVAAERPAFLDGACGDDLALRLEVESLLAAHDAAEVQGFIHDPARPLDPDLVPEPGFLGRTIGPYLVQAEVGHGGMGSVYRAVRADDQYDKQVAIKVVRRSFDPELVMRFRAERQILAGLDHPGIARLLDGGTTSDGLPYLVMDYVLGEPLTDFAESRKLPVRERLRLFREVCAAVHYAHQKLVVHRDLKPSNILVTSDGSPRLLDFGIAKLLSPEPSELAPTATLLRPMTPEYASPEQVRGLAITTATDVYSLGVLLCELLTGERPYHFATRDPEEVARVVTSGEPLRPSALARQSGRGGRQRHLEGDLDNIVLMALRKEPQRRYASVDQLSEDVRRHLDGRPVIARPDTLGYRASKFVRRNRGLVAAAVAVGLTLVGGLVATAWQARVARRERALAQQRFEDVRALARSFLFEFHDAIEKLPGSTEARQLLVTRGLEYLDRLAQQGADPGLQRELGRGYLRLGDLQGRPNYANLGDTAGALASYRKALAQQRALAQADPSDRQNQHDLSMTLNRIGTFLSDTQGDLQGAVVAEREALSLAEGLVAAAPDDVDEVRALLAINTKLGDILIKSGEPAEALRTYEKALPGYQTVATRTGTAQDRFNLFVAHSKVGNGLASLDRYPEALASFERMRTIIQALVDEDPHDAPARRALAVALNKIGDVLVKTGDPKGGLARFREALALREALAPADPKNVLARSDLVGSYVRIGDLLAKSDESAAAVEQYRLALPILTALCAKDPGSVGAAADRAGVLARLAEVEARMGRTAQALATLDTVVPAFEALLRVDPQNMESQYDLAATLLEQGRILAQDAALATSPESWRRARAAYARSLELWRGLERQKISGGRLEVGAPASNLRAAADGLALCDEKLRGAEAR